MANPEHVALVRQGAEAIAKWRQAHPDEQLDLSDADLSDADLSEADLHGANLMRAYLSGADFWGVNLHGANLSEAHLTKASLILANLGNADLTRANLRGANLDMTVLSGAELSGVDLSSAILSWATLSGANLAKAKLGFTVLDSLDVSAAKGLSDVVHDRPSSIGVDTLIASFRGAGNKLTSELRTFFHGAGVLPGLLDALPGIVEKDKYHSCFISYGQPDLEFAIRLCEDLEARGVFCWLYEMDKTVGEPTWREIEQKMEEYERMVVLCSIDALLRVGAKKEIDKQIDKSQEKLIPVSLDNRWTQDAFKADWAGRDLKTWLKDRNYADFANKPYEEALEELLKGLRRADKSTKLATKTVSGK